MFDKVLSKPLFMHGKYPYFPVFIPLAEIKWSINFRFL